MPSASAHMKGEHLNATHYSDDLDVVSSHQTEQTQRLTPRTKKGEESKHHPRTARLSRGFVHQVQFFARLEPDGLARRDAYFRAGSGIPPNPCFAWLHREYAKPPQFNAVTCDQRLLHAVEDGVDRVLRLRPRKSGPFHDPLDKVLFNQIGPPLSRNSFAA